VKGVLLGVSSVTETFPFGPCDLVVGGSRMTFHNGYDMVPIAKITAIEKGLVKEIGYNGIEGNYIVLQHGDYTESLYKHLASGSICAKVNQIVERGPELATAGATGAVTGAHLHFEVRVKGVAVDPLPYLQGTKVIAPYEEFIMSRPTLPTLTVLVPELFFRDRPNGTRIKYLEKRSYPYIGKSQLLGGYEWAEILLDNGAHVFCGLNPMWNSIKLIESTTITVEKIVEKQVNKPFEKTFDLDPGFVINLGLKAKV
jgi:hypothetical protein